TLNLGTVTVSGTTIVDQAGGTNGIVVVADTKTVTLTDGATLDGLDVTNHGSIKVSGPATLKNDIVSNDDADQITVDDTFTLTLDGTTIHDGHIDGLGTIEVVADSTIDNTAVIDIAHITVDDGKTLNLGTVTVSGTTIVDQAGGTNGIVVVADTKTVTLTDGATLDGLDVTNHGSIKVSGPATLKNDIVSNDAADQIRVDDPFTLTLDGTTIHDGHIDGDGTIEVVADSTIDNTAVIDIAHITVDDGKTLNLGTVTVSGTTLVDQAGGTNGIVVVADTKTVTLTDGATLDGLDVTNHGSIKVSGPATLKNDIVSNDDADQITVDD